MVRKLCWVAMALLVGCAAMQPIAAGPANAQPPANSKRIALVIGNSAYRNLTELVNPLNDATDIAAKLKTLKFEVLLAIDADHTKMSAVLEEFRSKVTRDHVALVFYAGHGVTVNRESFLLPIDTPDDIEVDDKGQMGSDVVSKTMISMASVLAPLESSKLGIVFLDACRNSATDAGLGMTVRTVSLGQSRSVPVIRGTASTEINPSAYSAGVFRAYATQLNNVASDGTGRNSPFTKALLRHIGTKGIIIQELMIRVRKAVMEETQNKQIPWEEAALNESFSFVEASPGSSPATSPRVPAARLPASAAPTAKAPIARKSTGTNVGVGTGF